jgi:hypothetical protein
VLTVRTQVTDLMLIFDQRHPRAVLAQYARHHHRRRPVPRAPTPTTPARPPDPHHHTRTDHAPIPPGRPDQRIRTSHLKDQVNAGGHILASHKRRPRSRSITTAGTINPVTHKRHLGDQYEPNTVRHSISVTWNLTAAEIMSARCDHGLRRVVGHGGIGGEVVTGHLSPSHDPCRTTTPRIRG